MDKSNRSKSQFSNQNVMMKSALMVDKVKRMISGRKDESNDDITEPDNDASQYS